MSSKIKTLVILVLLVLVAGVVVGIRKYQQMSEEVAIARQTFETQRFNDKVLEFSKLFIKLVLRAETEINFETRLQLENKVRDLNDPEILAEWQKFTESRTENEAQENVKNLLEMLVNKIKF